MAMDRDPVLEALKSAYIHQKSNMYNSRVVCPVLIQVKIIIFS